MKKFQTDLIDIYTKPDSKYIWILHLKNHFSKFSIFYTLESKKALEIAYYIGLFVCHLGIPEILQCDNNQEFKSALLVFLKKHNIKLINGRLYTPCIQRLVEKVNMVIKNKLQILQVANVIGT